MGHALCLSAEQTSGPLYERRYPGLFLGEVTRFMSQGRHYGCCLRGDDRSLSEGRWLGLCHRGDPQVSEKRLSLCLGESPSLYMIEVSLVSVWGETLESLSERRHPGPFLRDILMSVTGETPWTLAEGGTQVSGWREASWTFSERNCPGHSLSGYAMVPLGGDALLSVWRESPSLWEKLLGPLSEGKCLGPCLRGDTLVPFWEGAHRSLTEGRNPFLGGEMSWSFCELPWSLLVRSCSGSSERRCPSLFKVRCPGSFQRGDVLLSVWGELPLFLSERRLPDPWEWTHCCLYGKMLWCLSEERHPGLFLRKVVLVLAWEEKPWSLSEGRYFGLCLKVELWSFSKRNLSGLCQEETLWSFCERRTLVSVSGEML